ncbi:uncharacterized protein E0L32_009337 [Thyridium curvatum]|uniref:EH domain-containing protein n=1 Tax=Thyridium curvatum TaxID=1093900 RepID=A0A507AWS6_9PEZI|nr:uncharacterized protein E0L32_009337 [Thyridium curvatum]TPX09449.1 hypothetical protein E0L32_009337 [Thyridium curvatum]
MHASPSGRPDASPGQGSAAAAAALRGASLAFEKQQQQRANTAAHHLASGPSTPVNGALLAATSASRDASHSRPVSPSRSAGVAVGTTTRNRSPRAAAGPGHAEGVGRDNTGERQGSAVRDRSRERELARRVSLVLSSPASVVGSPHLLLPPGGGGGAKSGADPKSASFIAATLAASRSASPTPSPVVHGSAQAAGPGYFSQGPGGGGTGGRSVRARRGSVGSSSVHSVSTAGVDLPDTTPIPATNSLISMFEDKRGVDPVKRVPSPSKRPGLRVPTPPRELSPPRRKVEEMPAQKQVRVEEATPKEKMQKETAPEETAAPPPKLKPKPKPKPQQRPSTPTSVPPPLKTARASTEILSPRPRHIEQRPKITTSTPPASSPVGKMSPRIKRPVVTATSSTEELSRGVDGQSYSKSRREPKRMTVTTTTSVERPTTATSQSSDDSFVSASSTQTPRPPTPPRGRKTKPRQIPLRATTPKPPPPKRSLSTHSLQPIPRRSTGTGTPSNLALDSLANAIVASSLASSRHPTPKSKTPPPVPTSRRHLHHHHHPHIPFGHSHERSHSSGKPNRSPRRAGMLQTLRSPPTKSDEEDESNAAAAARRRHKNPLSVGGKHSHHEGARRRWRDEVTPRERRRYEAVWASNRGLFLPESEADCVCGVVVRDLWSRSRLPADELAEVWELVDGSSSPSGGGGGGRRGMLNKAEFVVGMWLIDQRLRGRKIPPRVSDSVWGSVRGWRVKAPEKVKGGGGGGGGKKK